MSKGLDKNGVIGLVLIGVILILFSYLTQPTEAETQPTEDVFISPHEFDLNITANGKGYKEFDRVLWRAVHDFKLHD